MSATNGLYLGLADKEASLLQAILMGEHPDYKFPSKRQVSADKRRGAGQQDSGHQELQVPNNNMSTGGDPTGSYYSMSTVHPERTEDTSTKILRDGYNHWMPIPVDPVPFTS